MNGRWRALLPVPPLKRNFSLGEKPPIVTGKLSGPFVYPPDGANSGAFLRVELEPVLLLDGQSKQIAGREGLSGLIKKYKWRREEEKRMNKLSVK